MNSQSQLSPKNIALVGSHWAWFLALGILLMVVGAIAISAAAFTTIVSVIFIGVLITIGGVVILLDSFKSWWGKWGGFLLHLLLGILYIAAGTMLINSPIMGSISITLLLGIFYIIVGTSRLVSSSSWKMARWGWGFFNGLITLLLGILILANWPASSLFIIGLFVGIDLFVAGWVYLMIALAAKNLAK